MKALAITLALLAAGCIGLERFANDTGVPVVEDTDQEILEWDDLSVDPSSVAFGQVLIGESGEATVVLSYQGAGDIIVSEAGVSGGDGAIVIQDITSLPTAITADDDVVIDLLFSPAAEQSYTGDLDIVTDHAEAGDISVSLLGTGYRDSTDTEEGPDISVSPSSVDFGLIDTGTTEARTLTVANIGTETFFLTDIQSTHPGIEWEFGEYMPLEFDPGESQEVTVSWTPTSIGALSTTLDFLSDCDGEETLSVPLEGESDDICDVCAPMISVDTGGEAYAMVFTAFSFFGPDTQTVYVTNSGDQTLTISDVYVNNDVLWIDGTFTTNWTGSSVTLEPWRSHQIDLTFTATGYALDMPSAVFDMNILHVVSDATNESDYAIELTGVGV